MWMGVYVCIYMQISDTIPLDPLDAIPKLFHFLLGKVCIFSLKQSRSTINLLITIVNIKLLERKPEIII